MLNKIFSENPLSVILLAASLVGSFYLIVYRLDAIEKKDIEIVEAINSLESKITTFKIDVNSSMHSLDSKLTADLNGAQSDMNEKINGLRVKFARFEGEG